MRIKLDPVWTAAVEVAFQYHLCNVTASQGFHDAMERLLAELKKQTTQTKKGMVRK